MEFKLFLEATKENFWNLADLQRDAPEHAMITGFLNEGCWLCVVQILLPHTVQMFSLTLASIIFI